MGQEAINKKPLMPQRLDLRTLLQEVCDHFTDQFSDRKIWLDIDVPDNLWVRVDAILMREAFHKLIDNAVEAMPLGGQLTITSLVGRQGLEIEIADSGPGLQADLVERIFDPFVTSKHDHAGLGLTMVRDIARAHRGTVAAMDCPDGGAAFTFTIPLEVARRAA